MFLEGICFGWCESSGKAEVSSFIIMVATADKTNAVAGLKALSFSRQALEYKQLIIKTPALCECGAKAETHE